MDDANNNENTIKKLKTESKENTNQIKSNEAGLKGDNINKKDIKSNNTNIIKKEDNKNEKHIDVVNINDDDDDDDCLLNISSLNEKELNQRYDIFCNDKFNTIFCKCNRCKEIYKNNNINFLIEDDLTYEPEEDDDLDGTLFERGVKVLNHASRVPLIECISGYNKLKDKLTDYFKEFAEQKKVVTDEDIKYFFDNFHIPKKKNIY
ncbi:hypothetical protein PIROE2DRAFT_62320 [Piromyces sp. E2]|nr:hypothetical protein PIROE2DRAFT_62320 [Piromyces sp. E2]|eukprot:OUM61731.1 hypothetical protein PIROE2DRAFT_62320 [Piromyces sp. E2]